MAMSSTLLGKSSFCRYQTYKVTLDDLLRDQNHWTFEYAKSLCDISLMPILNTKSHKLFSIDCCTAALLIHQLDQRHKEDDLDELHRKIKNIEITSFSLDRDYRHSTALYSVTQSVSSITLK